MSLKHLKGLILAAAGSFAMPTFAVELTISCGPLDLGLERQLCEQAVDAWAQQSGHTVSVSNPPENTDQRYFKYLIDLNNASDGVDVYQIDVIWPGLLSKHFLDLKEYIPEADIQRHHPTIIANNTVDGRLVGMPWFTDVGLLYYRKDLLAQYGFQVPTDWAELADVALYIHSEAQKAGDSELQGYVFQGAAYEGLTCNALEWIYAYGGGTVVAADGTITIDNPQAVTALARAASWVGTITPARVLSFNEEDARITFQLGHAVFMRNWPYAWALLNTPDSPVAGKVGVAVLPRGGPKGRHAATLGGWQLAVSKYSKHPAEAADLVRYLTSEAVQKQRAIAGAYAPTVMGLYEDPEVLAANPFFAQLRPVVESAVARPSNVTGAQYMAVTTHFWNAVHAILQGSQSARHSLAALKDELRLVKARGRW